MEAGKYNNSCIYKISKHNFIYIGSTCNFKKRMIQHKSACNNIKSKSYNLKIYQTIRLNGGWDEFEKVVVQNVCCENRNELREIEGEFIKNIGTMNSQISGRSQKKYRDDNREIILKYQKKYRKNNKDKILEKNKKYRKKNKDKILEKKKKYYKDNRAKIAEYRKQYYKNNKDKVKQKSKQYYENNNIKIKCSFCGVLVIKNYTKTHQKTKRCLKSQ